MEHTVKDREWERKWDREREWECKREWKRFRVKVKQKCWVRENDEDELMVYD